MNGIERLKMKTGSVHINMYIDAVFQFGIEEVLDYGYTINEVEYYLNKKKINIQNEILDFFRECKKYSWRETGEPIQIDQTFIAEVIGFDGNVTAFKRHLKKATAQELAKYRNVIFEKENFI